MNYISKCKMSLKFQKLENMSKIRLKFAHSIFPQAPELIEQLVQTAQNKEIGTVYRSDVRFRKWWAFSPALCN